MLSQGPGERVGIHAERSGVPHERSFGFTASYLDGEALGGLHLEALVDQALQHFLHHALPLALVFRGAKRGDREADPSRQVEDRDRFVVDDCHDAGDLLLLRYGRARRTGEHHAAQRHQAERDVPRTGRAK